MEYNFTDFGGILLMTQKGNFAINCGAKMKTLEDAYLVGGKIPKGMILTCEHMHRARNAANFCEQYKVPVLADMLMLAKMRWYPHIPGSKQILAERSVTFRGVYFSFHFLRYDSVDPVYLVAEGEGRKIGFVFDGKLDEINAQALMNCDELFLSNRLNMPSDSSSMLTRRLCSISNSDDEINALFHSFPGKINRQ